MSTPRSAAWSEAQVGLRTWYDTALGGAVHARIVARIEQLVRDRYALHCLQLGGTRRGVDLLAGPGLIHRIHVTGDRDAGLVAEPTQLPLATASVDLAIVCHVLEFAADPHALLREVDRILALDGHILVVGFDPWSPLGIYRLFAGRRTPWDGRFYGPGRVTDWFALLGWRVRQRARIWMVPAPPDREPPARAADALRRRLPRPAGIYLLLGYKHSIPFTPVLARSARAERLAVGGAVRPTRFTETTE